MATEKFLDLLRGVIVRTRERKIRWQDSEATDTYVLTLGTGKIRVQSWSDEDGDTWYGAFLEDGQGRRVDEELAYRGDEKLLLEEIYVTARASALQIDDLIETMLQDLEKDKERE
jgi:hypothetical protein